MRLKITTSLFAAVALLGLTAAPSDAHTDSDLIAVPAGAEAVVKLKPTHGCDGSPTIEVAIRAPLEGATAIDVEGWTATSTPDGKGNTVLEWKGGSLPADQTGEFPIEFVAPDTPGELLTFPSIQTCENGEELAWISGDPGAEFPAPRILILPAGFEPASELDQIAVDAPGRDQLSQVVDVDNPDAAETTTTAPGAETTTAPTPTEPEASATTATPEAAAPASTDDGDDGSNTGLIVGGVIALAVIGGGAAWFIRNRQANA